MHERAPWGAGKFVEGEMGEGREAWAIESLPAVQ